MHSLGFYHEHARPDRDQYIQIVKTNVRKGEFGGWHAFKMTGSLAGRRLTDFICLGKLTNFQTMKDMETSRNFNYDYSSIMHYGPYFFR